MQALTTRLVQQGTLKRAYFDSPRTLFETLSVFLLHGTGLAVQPTSVSPSCATTLRDNDCVDHDYYVITHVSLDKSLMDGRVQAYKVTPNRNGEKNYSEPMEISKEMAFKPWKILGREFDPLLRQREQQQKISPSPSTSL